MKVPPDRTLRGLYVKKRLVGGTFLHKKLGDKSGDTKLGDKINELGERLIYFRKFLPWMVGW